MKNINQLPRDCRQFIMPIKTLQSLPRDKKYKLLDVGATEKVLEGFLPPNIDYNSLDCINTHKPDYIHDLNTFPIPIKSNSFDIIVCLETLEHTAYPHRIMKELMRIAKPGALFLLSMPNEYNFYCRWNYLVAKKTSVNAPFLVVQNHRHVHLPRVKDVLEFFSTYVKIDKIDYQWQSKTGGGSGFKGSLFYLFDGLINSMISLSPSLFTRTVVVRGKAKTKNRV